MAVQPRNAGAAGERFALDDTFRLPERFAAINKMITRDLNARNTSPSFYLYTKDQIATYLKNPYSYEKQLRHAVVYMYGASSHFRRLIQYFVSLTDFAYVVSPFKIDTSTAKPKTIRNNFRKVLNLLASMDIKNQFEKILTVCIREDVFYGTIRETSDSIIIQQLPSELCAISSIEDNVLNVTFDFSYFDRYPALLDFYPEEFSIKYKLYQKNTTTMKWQELDAPNSFAIKCNKDILEYAMPPFIGLLREIYDLEDFRALKMTKTELENYAVLVMNLGINDDGEWQMDLGKAKEFWRNLDKVLPEEIGSVLTPMPIDKISFERTHADNSTTVSEAEQSIFTEAGVSSLLFNNERASGGSLLLSIKADQALTYSVVKSLEGMLNRFISRHGYGKYFRVSFLDCSMYNRKELSDSYLKAAQYGFPTISYYCAANGITQSEMDCLNFLEDDVLGLKVRFEPLRSSATQSAAAQAAGSDSGAPTDEGGRPRSELGDLTDGGEETREKE